MIKINGVNAWDYKLRLQKWTGDLDLAARKKTTEEKWYHETNDRFIEETEIVFTFIGQYPNEAALGSAFAALTANLTASTELSIHIQRPYIGNELLDLDVEFLGRFVSGLKPKITAQTVISFDLVMKWRGETLS